MIGGWFQARSRPDRTIYIGSQPAPAADDVMVIIPHTRLVASRMTGRLNAPDETSLLQRVQIVVDCLSGESAESFSGCDSNGFRITMLPLAQNRHEYGEAGGGHS